MTYTFDGPNKRIILGVGTTLDVRDVYSRWKDWTAMTDNSKYEQAFAVVGGEPVDIAAGIFITSYFFLMNGWRIRPYESSYSLTVSNGVLLTAEGVDPFVATLGTYQVLVRYSQPIKSETVATGGGGGSSITVSDIWQGYDVEGGFTPEQMLRLILSSVTGKLSVNLETGVVRTRDVADTKDRLVVVTDENDQRLSVTRDAT